MTKGGPTDRIEAYGMDAICEHIADGMTISSVADLIGVGRGSLIQWLSADAVRSARARETRTVAAMLWDEKAEAVLTAAKDSTDVARARELAHHYRWRASRIAPREYGDRVAVDHTGGVDVRVMPDEQLRSELAVLLGKATVALVADGGGEAQPSEVAGLLP